MTKFLMIFCLIILASCAHQRGPASIDGHKVAYDSMALGNVTANAIKRADHKQVCFDINLYAKDVKVEQAQASNWTLAWVDSQNRYHPLPVTQREPASVPNGGAVVAPYGAYTEYTNFFTTCAASTDVDNVKGLVLMPKELPYAKKELKLSWNH